MATNLQPLIDEVAAITTVNASAIALMEGFAARVAAEIEDPVAIQAILDGFAAQRTALAAAVVAHTPAAPTP